MDDHSIVVTIINGAVTLINTALGRVFPTRFPRKSVEGSDERHEAVESLGHFGKFVFSWMELSPDAREKLARSEFIRAGRAGDALMDLVGSAHENDSMLAICGYKGDYSKVYYKKNFQKCREVRRVFSYDAIVKEIETKEPECFALDGLKMHLNKNETGDCDVEVFVIPKGKFIKDLGGGNFNPPFSFGLAILRDGKNCLKKAAVHWEIDAKTTKDLIAIEGVIVDSEQDEVLTELAKLHKSIADSNAVLSSKNNPEQIAAICTELEEFWQTHNAAKGRTIG